MREIILLFVLFSLIAFSCENKSIGEKAKKSESAEEKFTSIPPSVPPPRLIKRPYATYPPSMQNLGGRAKVIVKISVGTDGKVFEAKAMRSNDSSFEAQAESLAYNYVFEPPVYDGKPRAVVFFISVIFDPDSIVIEKK